MLRGHAIAAAGFGISEKRYEPAPVLPSHAHDKAVLGVVLEGGGQEVAAGWTLDLVRRRILFRPGGHQHANQFGGRGARILVVELPAPWLDHVRQASRLATEPFSFESGDAWWVGLRLLREYRLGQLANPLTVEALMLEIAAA